MDQLVEKRTDFESSRKIYSSYPQIEILTELDIVSAREFGGQMSMALGFSLIDQTRIKTAISELSRNIFLYAKPGTVAIFEKKYNQRNGLAVVAFDQGPGIRNVNKALEYGYSSAKGLGIGLPAVQRIMDEFVIDSTNEGTYIEAVKWNS